MGYLFIIISILSAVIGVMIIYCLNLNEEAKKANDKLNKTRDNYYDLLLTNCILVDKIEKIKNLNVIDYENNDYYRELLTTEIE